MSLSLVLWVCMEEDKMFETYNSIFKIGIEHCLLNVITIDLNKFVATPCDMAEGVIVT